MAALHSVALIRDLPYANSQGSSELILKAKYDIVP
jgi:hypothetical protein